MTETLLITFREGLEAFLIVAIMLAYLTKTGRYNLVKPVYSGVVIALLISATTGYHINRLAQDPIWEGCLALIAGGLVASLTYYVMRGAHKIKQGITTRIDREAARDGVLAEIGIFAFTILMISREGMETALMLGSLQNQTGSAAMVLGGLAGLALAGLIGMAWIKQSHRINLRLFMQVTGVFLVLFAIQLFIYGIHELSEMSALPFVDNITIHNATESFEGDGIMGKILTYGLIAVPCAWLIGSYARDRFKKPAAVVAAP